MKVSTSLAVAMLLVAAGSSLAATQGTLGPTSTGSVGLSVQGPAVPRQVQVLGLSDMTVTSATTSELSTNPGSTMTFCIVDTYSQGVQIVVSSANGPGATNQSWKVVATDSSGTTLDYRAVVTPVGSTTIRGETQTGASSFTGTIPSTIVVASSSACGAGNVRLHTYMYAALPQTLPARSYADTLTIVVSPV